MHVYVMSAGARHIKIGISGDVQQRLSGIQSGCPHVVRVIRRWPSDHARRVERKAHQVLAKYRAAGEWFEVPQQVAILVVERILTATARVPIDTETVLFCRNCQHVGVVSFVPDAKAKFRCSACKKNDAVHVIELSNKFMCLDVS